MNTQDEDLNLVKDAAARLSEHFDSVQILVTRHEAGELDGTVNIDYGDGNIFTRLGHAENWLLKMRERTRIEQHS